MAPPDTQLLWNRIAQESIWGKRGLIKINNLWLPLAVILNLVSRSSNDALFIPCLAIIVSVIAWSLSCILTNDLADVEDDVSARKRRWIQHLSPVYAYAVILDLLAIGFIALLLSGAPFRTILAYSVAVFVGLFYSLKPLRFKERGILGLGAYSLAAAFAYVVMPWAWFATGTFALLVLSCAVFLDKWVNLHFHQVIDCQADRIGKIETYTVRVGENKARYVLKLMQCLASAAMIAGIIYIPSAFLSPGHSFVLVSLASIGAGMLFIYMSQRRSGDNTALTAELSPLYLSVSYFAFRIVPIILFLRLALLRPLFLIVLLFSGGLIILETLYFLRYRYE